MRKTLLAAALSELLLSACASPSVQPPAPAGVRLVSVPTRNVRFWDVRIVDRGRATYVEGRFSQTAPFGGGGSFSGYVLIKVTAPDGAAREYVVEPITTALNRRMQHGVGYRNASRSARFEVKLAEAPPSGSEIHVVYRG